MPYVPTAQSGEWVDVVFMDGDEAWDVLDMHDTQRLAECLAQWDYGTETDAAHTSRTLGIGSQDWTETVTTGGLEYVLAWNSHVGYVSLSRRPLDWDHTLTCGECGEVFDSREPHPHY